jgi:hypothetical protein
MQHISERPPAVNIDQLWSHFLEARDRAERSRRLEDGVAAGHAWRNFLSAFVGSPSLVPDLESSG